MPLIVHLEFQHPPPNPATSVLGAFAGQLVPNPSLQQVGDGFDAVYPSWLTMTSGWRTWTAFLLTFGLAVAFGGVEALLILTLRVGCRKAGRKVQLLTG